MSVFIDLDIRNKLDTHIHTLGTQNGSTLKERTLDLSVYGLGAVSSNIYITSGGGLDPLPQDRDWLEYFIIKSPQIIVTPANQGISWKPYQYGIWVKTPKDMGVFYNEMVSGIIEEHFPNNMHIPLDNGDTLTVLKTYQQSAITLDSSSGRLFNRVFIDCENYFKNNK